MKERNWIDNARALRASGMSYRSVSKEIGIPRATVFRWLNPDAKERYDSATLDHYWATRDKQLETQKSWRDCNKERERARFHVWYEGHREDSIRRARAWEKEHPDQLRVTRSAYNKTHTARLAAHCAKRRAQLSSASVSSDRESIDRIYVIAHSTGRVRCYLCGEVIPVGQRHVDHIVPLSRGGDHSAANLAVACRSCNLRKMVKLPQEVGVLL